MQRMRKKDRVIPTCAKESALSVLMYVCKVCVEKNEPVFTRCKNNNLRQHRTTYDIVPLFCEQKLSQNEVWVCVRSTPRDLLAWRTPFISNNLKLSFSVGFLSVSQEFCATLLQFISIYFRHLFVPSSLKVILFFFSHSEI